MRNLTEWHLVFFKSKMLLETFLGFLLSLDKTIWSSQAVVLELRQEQPNLGRAAVKPASFTTFSTLNKPQWFLLHSQEFINDLQLATAALFSELMDS